MRLGVYLPVLPPINSARSGRLSQEDGQGWSSPFTETQRPAKAAQLSKSGLPTSGPARGEGGEGAPSAPGLPVPSRPGKAAGFGVRGSEGEKSAELSPKPRCPLTSALSLAAAFPPFIVCFFNNIKKIAIYLETLGN